MTHAPSIALPVRLALTTTIAALLTTATQADDLVPPPWPRVGAPNYSTAAEWEFFGPIVAPDTTKVADGTDVPLVIGDGTGGMPPDMLPDGDIAWDPYDGDGGYLGGANGIGDGELNFRVGNWIDNEPLKIIHMQITYDRGGSSASPYVDMIIPFDPLGIDRIELMSVTDGPIAGDPTGRFHRLEVWEIEPNPDFESIRVIVPDGVMVDQVVIDTISTVPEPTSLALLGLGCFVGLRRRHCSMQ